MKASTRAVRRLQVPRAGPVAAARCRWPTGRDENVSETSRGSLYATGAQSRCPWSGRSRPGAPSNGPAACHVCENRK